MDEHKPLMKEKKLEPPQPLAKRIIKEDVAVKRKILRFMERGVYIVAIFGMAITMFYGYANYKIKVNIVDKLTHDKADLKADGIVLQYTIDALIQQRSGLENKLANLKNKEDLSRRDLEAYIIKKFRVIPQVVAHEVAAQVVKLTKERGVPFSLLVGLIEVESQFKPWAISKKDARGLMQVMPFWIKKKKEIGMDLKSKYDLHDISTNIKAGIQVFKYHLKEADNDINQGLYLYVGKDRTYANKVFNAMGRFEVFRSTLDTALRDEENKEFGEVKAAPKKGNRLIN